MHGQKVATVEAHQLPEPTQREVVTVHPAEAALGVNWSGARLSHYLFRPVERLSAAGAAPEAPEEPPLRPQQVRVLVHRVGGGGWGHPMRGSPRGRAIQRRQRHPRMSLLCYVHLSMSMMSHLCLAPSVTCFPSGGTRSIFAFVVQLSTNLV